MPAIIGTIGTIVKLNQAVNGNAASNAVYASQIAAGEAAAIAAYNSQLATASNSTLADTLMTNLSLTAAAGVNATSLATLKAAIIQALDAYPASKGQVIANLGNLLSNLESDATWAPAALAFNNQTAANYSYSVNTSSTTAGSPSSTSSFTLTTNIETFNGTTGNDLFTGIIGDAGVTIQVGDRISGGQGIDTLRIALGGTATALATGIAGVDISGVEIISMVAPGDVALDASTLTDLTTLRVENAAAMSGKTITSGTNLTTLSVATAAGAQGAGALTWAGPAAATTLDLIFNGFAGATGATARNFTVTGAATTTFNIKTSTAANLTDTLLGPATTTTLNIEANTALRSATGTTFAAATKVNITGAGAVNLGQLDLAAAPTIDASKATGAITATGETAATTTTFLGGSAVNTFTTASTGTINVTTLGGADIIDIGGSANTAKIDTGAGNDTVIVGVSTNITAGDTINGGDGTDTIRVTDATLNGTTKTTLALGASNFEVVGTSAAGTIAASFNALGFATVHSTAADTGVAAAAAAGATANGSAGAASITGTTENTSTVIVQASRVGQAGQAVIADAAATTGGVGGAGVQLTARVDSGANSATLKTIGGITLTGGRGGAADGANDTSGKGGDAVNATTIETLNIEVSGTNATGVAADTVTFTAGAAGATANGAAGGGAGSGLTVSTNATVNITSSLTGSTAVVHNNLNLGTVTGTNVTINAGTFEGVLTLTAASGNVTVNGGKGVDNITGGAGLDNVTGGNGNDVISTLGADDTIDGGAGTDNITGGTGQDVMTGGAGADTFVFAAGDTATPSSTLFDTITDYTTGADIISMGAQIVLAAQGTAAAGQAAISATGLATFNAADNTLALRLTAVAAAFEAATATTTLEAATFAFGSDSYLYITDNVAGLGANDVLVKLTGIQVATGMTLTGQNITAIA